MISRLISRFFGYFIKSRSLKFRDFVKYRDFFEYSYRIFACLPVFVAIKP